MLQSLFAFPKHKRDWRAFQQRQLAVSLVDIVKTDTVSTDGKLS